MLPVFPTCYFGSIEYYRSLCQFEEIQFEAKEHFIKQTARSRCEILGANGVLRLSIPVIKHQGSHTSTDEVLLNDRENWRKNHWKSIESSYASSVYFDYYGTEIKELLFSDTTSLLDFNLAIHNKILSWLDLDITHNLTSDFHDNLPLSLDYRSQNFESSTNSSHSSYTQVFREKNECVSNLSILDLVLNQGPMTRTFLF